MATAVVRQQLDFTCFGVGIGLSVAGPELVAPIEAVLPPGATPGARDPVATRFIVRADPDQPWLVSIDRPGGKLGSALEPEVAVKLLEERFLTLIAQRAEGWTFVHGGVAVVGDRAIVLPGQSLSGRSTLVGALARAGAEPWSESHAVFDPRGVLHPFGGSVETGAASIGLVATAPYRPGAHWDPERGGPGDAALALLDAAATRDDPERLLQTLSSAVSGAVALRGERGEADEVAPRLLAALDG